MAVSICKAILQGELQRVWALVTDVSGYAAWRGDLDRVQVLNKDQFVEYTKDGYATTFTVTACEPYSRWEFDLKNQRIRGHWTGRFRAQGHATQVEFTEEAIPKNKLLSPFVKPYLKRQQARFLADLARALEQ